MKMDYLKKSLKNLDCNKTYDEIDTRLATGWYVNTGNNKKKKTYKTSKVEFKVSKKIKK